MTSSHSNVEIVRHALYRGHQVDSEKWDWQPADTALTELEEQLKDWADCMNYAWTIICNVSEGDWTKQNQEWQDAAAKCRDQYHALLASNPASASEET